VGRRTTLALTGPVRKPIGTACVSARVAPSFVAPRRTLQPGASLASFGVSSAWHQVVRGRADRLAESVVILPGAYPPNVRCAAGGAAPSANLPHVDCRLREPGTCRSPCCSLISALGDQFAGSLERQLILRRAKRLFQILPRVPSHGTLCHGASVGLHRALPSRR